MFIFNFYSLIVIPLSQQSTASTSSSEQSSTSSATHTNKYKVSMCRDALIRACPRGDACTFAHSEDELEKLVHS